MWSASLPHCSSQFIYARMWGRGVCYRLHCLSRSSHNPPVSGCSRIATSPVCPSCLSPPLLPVWTNVSSLSPWLSDFCAVRFSVSSGCFLFLDCCPSFGCARRCSVSTYTSILVFLQDSSSFILGNVILMYLDVCFLVPKLFGPS